MVPESICRRRRALYTNTILASPPPPALCHLMSHNSRENAKPSARGKCLPNIFPFSICAVVLPASIFESFNEGNVMKLCQQLMPPQVEAKKAL